LGVWGHITPSNGHCIRKNWNGVRHGHLGRVGVSKNTDWPGDSQADLVHWSHEVLLESVGWKLLRKNMGVRKEKPLRLRRQSLKSAWIVPLDLIVKRGLTSI
jgi:hypothetical protein